MAYRQLRYEHGVEDQLSKLKIEIERFDQIMEGIEEVLSMTPEAFPIISGTKLSFCRTNEFVGTNFLGVPSLAIYFHYTADTVSIVAVEESELEGYGF